MSVKSRFIDNLELTPYPPPPPPQESAAPKPVQQPQSKSTIDDFDPFADLMGAI